MKLLGMEFAPLSIPMERRLQTFAVFFWISSFFFMGPMIFAFMVYLLFYTQYYWISLFYLAWYLGDRNTAESGGRRSEWVRKWQMWKNYAAYFPINLVKEKDFDPKFNYIVGSHPHGILCSGAFCNFATEGTNVSKVFPNIQFSLTTLSAQFVLPFYREFFLSSGAITASRKGISHVLRQHSEGGAAVVIIVGGAPESLDTHPNQEQIILILKPRKGFIRLALQHGAHLVPSFSFGENEVYDQVSNPRGSKLRRFQDYLRGLIGLAPVLLKGRGIFQYSFGIIPNRRPITTVVGTPIPVERVLNPTEEQINDLHSEYIEKLTDLFERNKTKYYPFNKNIKLQII